MKEIDDKIKSKLELNLGTGRYSELPSNLLCDLVEDLEALIAQERSSAVRADKLWDVCTEFASVRADNGNQYMYKWFNRNSERLVAELTEGEKHE